MLAFAQTHTRIDIQYDREEISVCQTHTHTEAQCVYTVPLSSRNSVWSRHSCGFVLTVASHL